MKITGFTPRPDQLEVLSSKVRFPILDAGRRWGKSVTGLNWLLEGACNDPGPEWWVAPVYAQSKVAFRELLSAGKKGGGDWAFKDISHSELRIAFVNDATIEFKSGDNPDNLRGSGLKRIVVDEAARVKRDAWEEVLRPAVSDTHGRVMFISTPKGKNWFFELYSRGQDALQPEYKSWKFPTSDNPKIAASDIEQAQQTLPVDVFNQEYLAEFLENSAGVFRNVKSCIGAQPADPIPGASYCAGLDLARLTDFTVLTILDEQGHEVYRDRFNLLDWAIQKERVIAAINRYDARLLLDSTGIGDPIYDDLRRAGLTVDGYKFTAESKKKLIESLMLAFEKQEIRIIGDAVTLGELDVFEYTIGSSGSVHYSAPDGYHDDCVISLALAWWTYQRGMQGPRVW